MRTIMTRHHGKFVSYLRVSTDRQGASGLGIEAQRAAVESFLNGGSWKLVSEQVEVESGKRDDNRPALAAAFEACRLYGAKLVISRLDRLRRDAHFLLGLQKANRLTIGILALVAEQEREAISARTKAALAAATARGQKLGKPKGYQIQNAEAGRARGHASIAANADSFAARLAPVMVELKDLSANAAAAELDRRGIATARGGKWTAKAVINLRQRLNGE
jgi:DNA invertase Pin-like site-specific DNA recombinase